MSKLRCVNCSTLFTPAPQVPNQTYCSKPACQKTRRQQWQKSRLQSDPDYRDNQSRAQKAWSEKNPDYWRQHRQTKSDYENSDTSKQHSPVFDGVSQSVKMDSLSHPSQLQQALQDGVFRLRVLERPSLVKMDVWIVELSSIHEGFPPISPQSRDD
jgi:hypothetical protein